MKKIISLFSLLVCASSLNTLGADSPNSLVAVPAGDLAKIREAAPLEAAAQPLRERKVLVMWLCKGYYHKSIPWVNEAIQIIGEQTGAYVTEFTNDPAAFTASNLSQYDAIIFNNTTHLDKTGNEAMRQAIVEYVQQGGGVVGIHAATDNFYQWPEVAELMGGAFDGHPWGASGTWRIENSDPMHPMNHVFDGNSFDISDELYQLKDPYNRSKQRVLLAVDVQSPMNAGVNGKKREDNDYGLSWVRQFDQGRLYYSAFGHNPHVSWDARILKTWLDGIQFAVGDLKIPTDSVAKADAATLFIALRDGDFSTMGKRDLCRRLEPLATPQNIPALAPMLLDSEISHFVRKIIEGTPCEASEAALLVALEQAAPELKSGMISSLGILESQAAVAPISLYLADPDMKTAQAAMRALGLISGADALDALSAAQPETDTLRMERAYAMIECAYGLMKDGERARAEQVFEEMVESEYPYIQIAAYKGMIVMNPESANAIISGMNTHANPEIQQAGAAMISELPVESLHAFAARLDTFSEPVQLTILDTIRATRDHSFQPVVVQLLNTPALQLAAIRTLSTVGDASLVMKLFAMADESREVKNAVISTVSSINDPEVDRILVEIVRTQAADTMLAIDCLGARKSSPQVIEVLASCLPSTNSALPRKAGKVLVQHAQVSDIPVLLAVVRSAPESFASKVVVKIITDKKDPDAAHGIDIIKQAIRTLPETSQQVALVRAFAKYPEPESIELLNQLKSNATYTAAADEALALIEVALQEPPQLDSSHGQDKLSKLQDQVLSDRWTSGVSMKPGMWFQIKQASPQAIETITLDNTAGSHRDHPRGYEVFVSDDGADWGDPVAYGQGANPVTTIELGGRVTRYVRIVLTESNGLFWSIHDLKINGHSVGK